LDIGLCEKKLLIALPTRKIITILFEPFIFVNSFFYKSSLTFLTGKKNINKDKRFRKYKRAQVRQSKDFSCARFFLARPLP
jgi:hypothetical protein